MKNQRKVVCVLGLIFFWSAQVWGQVVYETSFDNLAIGATENPSNEEHDGWTSVFHPGNSFGEIQNEVANGGHAIHQYTDVSNTNAQQSIDDRKFSLINTDSVAELIFDVDFYAASSDLTTRNSYVASATIDGDGQVFGFSVGSGNGQVRSDIGVSLDLSAFNGVDNNERIVLSVGQNLAWNQWHEVELSADLLTDEWLSVTVSDQTQSLTGIDLPRNFLNGTPITSSFMDRVTLQAINVENFGDETSDSVYFDNLRIEVVAIPEPCSPPV